MPQPPIPNLARTLRPILACAVLPLAAAACGSADASRTPFSAERETLEDGRVEVRYAVLPDEATAVAEPDLRIGAVDGEPWETFGSVRAIAAGADGTIYVLDAQVFEVRAFAADGRYLATLARRGEGPGEIRQANGLLVDPDGTLWVQDHGARALLRLSPEGGEVERHPMMVGGWAFEWDAVIDGEGVLAQTWSTSLGAGGFAIADGVQTQRALRYVKWYDPRAQSADSLMLGEVESRYVRFNTGENAYMNTGVPYAPRNLSAIARDGSIWLASSDAYHIARISRSGDTTLVVQARREGLPVTGEDREEWFTGMERYLQQAPSVRGQIESVFPARKPVLSRLMIDDGGRLWVQRERGADAPAFFDVFDRDGDFLGAVEMPVGFAQYPAPIIRDGRLYGVVTDEFDVPFVVRAPLPGFAR